MFNIKALSKFDQNQVVSLYKTGNYTQQELADNFGVSVDTIRRVLKNDKESKLAKTISASLKAAVGVAINAPVTVTVEVPVVEDTIGGSRRKSYGMHQANSFPSLKVVRSGTQQKTINTLMILFRH